MVMGSERMAILPALRRDGKGGEAMSKFEVIRGVEGCCLALDDTCIAGPKPWGGGTVIRTWETDKEYKAVNMQSRWHQFFGTPERVAITFATIEEWLANEVRMSPVPEEGKEWFAPGSYYLLGEAIGANFKCNATALLEWLRGDAE